PVDTRLLRRKALDPVLAGLSAIVINLAWVDRAWIETHDNSLPTVLTRFAVMATSVWLIGKLWRDADEFRNGYYGFRSKRALRSPERPSRWRVWRGDRLHQRVSDYRRDLDALLAAFGWPSPAPEKLDRSLAEGLARRLWRRMPAEIHRPLDEWDPLPADRKVLADLWDEQPAVHERRAHLARTITLVVPLLAADPATLALVAALLRSAGRAVDATVVDFHRMLGQELWAEFAAAAGGSVPPPGHRTWRARLAEHAKQRTELRAEYLAGPRKVLLEVLKQHYLDTDQDGHPNLERARAALAALEFELVGMGKPRRDPLELVAQLADQRARSAADAAAAEERGLAAGDPAATRARLVEMRQLAAGMRVLRSAAQLSIEVQLTRAHRREVRKRWDAAIARAVVVPPNPVPYTLLERLLLLAGLRGPATAAELAARYGGTGWADTLSALAEMGALEADAAGGYRVTADLAALWRAARPRLRHAVRADATYAWL